MSSCGIRGLKRRWCGSAALAKGAIWIRLNSGGIQAGEVRGGSHGDGRCGISSRSRDATEGQAPGVRAPKNSEFREEE